MITEEQMTRDQMTQTAKTHICAVCNGELNVAWVKGAWALRCRDPRHDKIIVRKYRRKSEHELEVDRAIKEVNRVDSKSLMTMPEAKMLERVKLAKFEKDLTENERTLLVKAAIAYGFDPMMGELTIYQGRPWVSIDGRFRKAQESGDLDGIETRPATKQERTDWEIPEGDFFYRTELWRKGSTRPIVAWGRVFKAETLVKEGKEAFLPVQKNPQRMAEKRAEGQALRKGFHINAPFGSLEDIGIRNGNVVDVSTGEILQSGPIDVKATVVEPSAGPEPTVDKKQAEAPETNLGTLLTWLQKHGKTYTREWLFKNQSFQESDLVALTPEGLKNRKSAVAELKQLAGWTE